MLIEDRRAMRLLADAYMIRDKYDGAIQVLKEITSRFPTDGESHFLLGVCYYRIGQYDDSIVWYEKALSISPNNTTAKIDLENAFEKIIKKYDNRDMTRWTKKKV